MDPRYTYDLGFNIHVPMRLYCDNKVVISITHNLVQHDHTKDIEVDCRFIKEKLQSRQICTPYGRIRDQLADIFTKALSSPQFSAIVFKPGMHNLYMPAWGEVLTLWIY